MTQCCPLILFLTCISLFPKMRERERERERERQRDRKTEMERETDIDEKNDEYK